ncbi:MAG: hypothetical protein HOP12_14560 [Candidatus Eisenbacteria bacterium]|uniref:DUF2154 domain-containing protein n=1 Tax=Eiseniibacteriota bacterium TaxID=2212470 RepID=A0A849SNI4_UNCEI|nr:hypothetical protein [Candidatus Eisenbacteria bacterium]
MKALVPCAVAALAILTAAPPGHASAVLQTEARSWKVTPNTRVRLDFPVGDLHVKAASGSEVRFELQVRCKNGSTDACERRASRLKLEHHQSEGDLRLKLEGYPKATGGMGFVLDGILYVPSACAVNIDMGVGDLEVDGMRGDLDVDLGVGEATVWLERAAISSVNVDVGIGSATVDSPDGSTRGRGWLGRTVHWSPGGGTSRISLDVGVGEAQVKVR